MAGRRRTNIEKVKKGLLDRREELLGEVQEVGTRDADAPFRTLAGEVSDSGDEAAASAMIDTDQAAVGRRDLGEIRAIDAALERIAAGKYGECTECQQVIPHERLSANPAAERCFICQDRYEKTHGHAKWPLL